MDPINQQPTVSTAPAQPIVPPTPQPVAPQPMPQPTPTMMPEMPKEHTPWGPIIGVIVILILLVAAAIYVWGQKLNNDEKQSPITPAAPVSQIQNTQPAAAAEPVDELTSLEVDLDASVEGLDDSNF